MSGIVTTASLRGRLSRWLALQTMLGLGLVCVAVYVLFALTVSERQDEALSQKQNTVEHLLSGGHGERNLADVRQVLGSFLAGHDELSLRLMGRDGRVLFETSSWRADPNEIKSRAFDIKVRSEDGGMARAILVLDKRMDDALLARLAWTLAVAALVGALAVSVGGFMLVRLGLAPLHKLVEQTGLVTATDLERRLDGADQAYELQPLIQQFNALLDRLGVAYKQMEAFNADVAHELNTPLATLISSCELALRKPRSADDLRETLSSNLEELRRLAGIVGDMLFLSNAERGGPARREWTPCISVLAEEVIEFHEAALLDAGLAAKISGDASATVDGPLLRRALSNLLGNATRYASPESTVLIQIDRKEVGWVRVAVYNEGATIGAEHLPRLFDRFYRADPARSPADRNHGLGLSIVAAIARMHGGHAFAESAAGVTRIGMMLPDDSGRGPPM